MENVAFFEMNFHSDTLKRGVSVNVIIPESAKTVIGLEGKAGESYKTLYLLHGLSDDHTTWHRRTSIERYAAERGIAVVMPSGGRSWYTDEGEKFLSFIAEELPRVCRAFFKGMSEKREDTLVAGNSMGGYGAVKMALLYPETFGGVASFSGGFAIDMFSKNYFADEWKTAFGSDFSDPAELMGSRHDVFKMASDFKGENIPKIYIGCGNEDVFIKSNRDFSAHLEALDIPHYFEEADGGHNWAFWDKYIQSALDYLLK